MRNRRYPLQARTSAVLCSAAVLLLFCLLTTARAVEQRSPPEQEPTSTNEADRSLDKAVLSEKQNLDRLQQELRTMRQSGQALEIEINAYKIQNSAQANLLHLGGVPLEELQKALASSRASLEKVETALQQFRLQESSYGQVLSQTREQLELNERQLGDIREGRQKNAISEPFVAKLSALTGILSEKQKLLGEIQGLYTAWIGQEESMRESLATTCGKLESQILERKTRDLFLRDATPLADLLKEGSVAVERIRVAERFRALLSPAQWGRRLKVFWQNEKYHLATILILFGILQLMIYWLRGLCRRFCEKPEAAQCPWTVLTLRLFRRSLPLLGTALFLYVFAEARNIYSADSLIRLAIELIAIWLFARWGLDFLRLWALCQKDGMSPALILRLRLLLHALRIFAIVYSLGQYLLQDSGYVLVLVRLLFEGFFVAWNFDFWRKTRLDPASFPVLTGPRVHTLKSLPAGIGYLVPLGGLVLDLAGYGRLSLFWLISWGRTAGILFWGGLTFLCLQEWGRRLKDRKVDEESPFPETRRPLMWLAVRLLWVAWFGWVVLMFFFAWGAKQRFLLDFLGVMNYPLSVGSMTLKFSGVLYALLTLLFTHTAARIWRYILQSKILSESGLEAGLQESIVSICTYVIWVLGILVSLSVLGVNTTSLTVAFGALGIGLGFGLQAIFNNFISGLILLFERPIQTGDAVEINGVWGIVKKINVRSTIVQTWDNASLIIPNSEFISSQVTNWSFKDLRLRRTISVGVAYGSDTLLVRDTLLEIARSTSRVLRSPEPDVLFSDFGDSALVFNLRVWTTVRHALILESTIRYEIDRLFRERDITIAFPQRDVHLYLQGEAQPAKEKRPSPAGSAEGGKVPGGELPSDKTGT